MDIPAGLLGLANYGALGIVVLLLAFGVILPKGWVDRLLKNKDDQITDLKAQVKELLKFQEPFIKLVESLNDKADRNREEVDK